MKGNYHFDYLKINDYQDYTKYFYKTDHHWSYRGSYQGYKDILAMMLNEEKPKEAIKKVVFQDINFNGSSARGIRKFDDQDIFKAYQFDLGEYLTYIDGEEATYGKQNEYFQGHYTKLNYKNYYGDFYGSDYGEVIFDFRQPEKDNLLILSNSFVNAIAPLIASHFNQTYIVKKNYKSNGDFSLDRYIKIHDIDKVLFIVDYTYLIAV